MEGGGASVLHTVPRWQSSRPSASHSGAIMLLGWFPNSRMRGFRRYTAAAFAGVAGQHWVVENRHGRRPRPFGILTPSVRSSDLLGGHSSYTGIFWAAIAARFWSASVAGLSPGLSAWPKTEKNGPRPSTLLTRGRFMRLMESTLTQAQSLAPPSNGIIRIRHLFSGEKYMDFAPKAPWVRFKATVGNETLTILATRPSASWLDSRLSE